jgi:uncharacterized protein (DUF885 family)
MKKIVSKTLLLAFFSPLFLIAQNKNLDALYEQASETSGLVVQYTQDVRSINYAYGPMPSGGGFGGGGFRTYANSPEQRERLVKLNQEYLAKLAQTDFESMSIHGQVDYVVLKRKIEEAINLLNQEAKDYKEIEKYIPFGASIYALEKNRRRGGNVSGQEIANQLNDVSKEIAKVKQTVEKEGKINQNKARFSASVVEGLKARLKSVYEFYNGYDPLFTWWVPEPYKKVDAELGELAKLLSSKTDAKPSDDGSGIGGQPTGREEFNRLLKLEMIGYTPEELIKLAEQEFAWCEAELLKASQEMGFGKDWKAAQEKVKNSYVPAGTQPELIIKLYNDAQEFINEHKLYDAPAITHETWGMQMMSPERQLISPFFLGGRDIIISYPTNTMEHEHKMMSMRGNNPYFSRGTVQHELVPGHHLQSYIQPRYKAYRADAFRTPFWTEGWTLYWELLLYKEGFAKTPEERIGMLFWRMHRCARIMFSTKYHLGEWTPQQCVDYLVDRVGHEYSNAHAEVKRSFEANYGPLYQLAYLVGGLQLFSIHKELVESGKMSNHEFHDKVIKQNYLPMEMVRATLTNQKLSRDYKPNWKFYEFKK